MRIGIIAHLKFQLAEPFAGGLEMHTHLLARKLRARGHQVTVFASAHSAPDIGLEAICEETSLLDAGTAEAADLTFFREHHAYLSLMNALRHRDFDVIHNNSLHYLPVAMADALPVPVVTTLHTPPFCWLESGIRISQATNVTYVAVSNAIKDAWTSSAGYIRVIPNGIDVENFIFAKKPDPEPYLVWFGRIVPEKGLHHAISAAGKIGLPLRFAGPISDRDYFAEHVQPQLSSTIRYEGHLPHNKLSLLVGGAQAFLCTPCWEEPYGLVVAEALACGVPVASFARGAIPGILDNTCGALAIPDDAGDLARAALTAMKFRRQDCRRRAASVCNAENMISAYESLYGNLTATKRQFDLSLTENSTLEPVAA